MPQETAAILGYFIGENLARAIPPRTICQLAAYTAEPLKPDPIHVLRFGEEQTYTRLKKEQPKLTGISIANWQEFFQLPTIVARIKQAAPKTITVVGGLYPSFYYRKALEVPGVDVIARGWGEAAWEKITGTITAGKALKTISGYPGVYLSDERLPADNLPQQPIPPIPLRQVKQPLYTALTPDIASYVDPKATAMELIEKYFWPNVLSGLGCQSECIFCIHTLLHRLDNFGRRFVEERPPSLVAEEIKYLLDLTGVQQIPIYLTNPDSLNDPDHFLGILDELEKRGIEDKVIRTLDVRVHSLYDAVVSRPQLLDRLRGKVHRITLAPESLDPGTQSIVGKLVDFDELRETISICHEIGALPMVQLIVGFPIDSDNTLNETLSRLIKLRNTSPVFILNIHRATPFPGTTLYDQAVAEGLINATDMTLPSVTVGEALMETKFLTKEEVDRWIAKMVRDFYTLDYFQRIKDEDPNPFFVRKAEFDAARALRDFK